MNFYIYLYIFVIKIFIYYYVLFFKIKFKCLFFDNFNDIKAIYTCASRF